MSDYGPTSPHEILSGRPVRRLLANRSRRWIVVSAALACAVIGLSVVLVTPRSTTAANPVPAGGVADGSGSGGGASNARSGPATGGASGTVDSVSTSSFTMTTSAGQTVTVDEVSSTTYQNGTKSTSANAITTGQSILVLGTTNGTTITATQVIMTPAGGDGSATPSAAPVIPFQSGAPATSKQVGQIPANYNQGAGGCPFGGDGSVDAPVSSASSSRSRTTPAGVLCFSGSASSELAW